MAWRIYPRLSASSRRQPQKLEQFVEVAVIGNDDVGPGLDQPVALPVAHAGAEFLVAGDADGHPACALHLFDLHEAVAEPDQRPWLKLQLADEPFDDHPFGKVLVVVNGAINA